MKYINCPICSRAISSQVAGIKQCPYCYHPLDVKVWEEKKAEKVAKEKEKLEELINNASKKVDKKELKKEKKEKKRKEKEKKKRHKTMTKPEIEKEILKEITEKKDDKGKLTTITKNDLIRAYNIQKRTNGWTFYNENDIVQRTLENRFNFLLVAYTIFLTAYFQPKIGDYERLAILFIGLVIVSLLSLAIYRTKNRFNITLDIVHSLDENDVSPIIHRENKGRHHHWFNKWFRYNSIHGKYIPIIMIITFLIGIIFNIAKLSGLIDLIKGVFK